MRINVILSAKVLTKNATIYNDKSYYNLGLLTLNDNRVCNLSVNKQAFDLVKENSVASIVCLSSTDEATKLYGVDIKQ